MTGPIVEIARFPSSEAYRATPSVINSAFAVLAQVRGVLGIYHGLKVGDKTSLYGVIVWKTIEHHQAILNDKPTYRRFLKELSKSITGPAEVVHVPLMPDPATQLLSPVLEFIFLTMKPLSSEVWEDVVRSMFVDLTQPVSWGKLVEKEDTFVILAGHNSPQASFN